MSCRKSTTCDTKNKYRVGRILIPCRHDIHSFFVLKIVTYNYADIQRKTSAIQEKMAGTQQTVPHRALQGIELPYLRIYQYDDIPP